MRPVPKLLHQAVPQLGLGQGKQEIAHSSPVRSPASRQHLTQRKDGVECLPHIARHGSIEPTDKVDNFNINTLQISRNSNRPTGPEREELSTSIAAADWQAVLGGARLSMAELQGLNAMQGLRHLHGGEMAFTRHQSAQHLVAVLKGSVGLGLARDDEPFDLERTVHGPQWLDVSSAWLGGSFSQDARAVGDAWLIDLPLNRMRELIAYQPAMLDRVLTGLAHTISSLTSLTHDLMHKDAEHRLAVWLLQRCEPEDPTRREIAIALNERKRDIAAQLAITPETLSRMMRQLNRKGVIEVQGYCVKVLDLPSLQALAQD